MPAPISELAARRWDAIVVGGGHNGLTAAAYLARSGRSVLVLERNQRLGGACTLERPFEDAPDYIVSPCAYVVGLLDEVVIRELELERHGYRVTPADPNLWCPLPDGSSLAAFLDPARTAAHMRGQGFSERDIRGLEAYEATYKRLRLALRTGDRGGHLAGSVAQPGRDRAHPRRRRRADLDRVRGLDRRRARPLHRRRAPQARALRAGGDRHLRRAPRPGHRLDQAHAPPGGPARAGLGLGLCRGRHGTGLVRDRPGRARGRSDDRDRHAGRRDRPRRGGSDRRRRVPQRARW